MCFRKKTIIDERSNMRGQSSLIVVLVALLMRAGLAQADVSSTACALMPGQQENHANGSRERVGNYGVVYKGKNPPKEPESPCQEVVSRKEVAESLDVSNMLYSGRTVTDNSSKMLEVPESFKQFDGKDFVTAKTPPEIDFTIIPVEPRWARVYHNQYESGWWGHYCQSEYYPENKKFYAAVADHGTYDAHLYLLEYDAVAKKTKCLPEFNYSVGRGKNRFGDGIIHGWLDFYRSKDLPRPNIWFCTYWAKFPEPTEQDYATGYDGGHIVSYDPVTEEFVDYGAPIPRTSWVYHRVDTRRGILYAVSFRNEFLVWDINSQRTEWAGCLPNSMVWNNRSLMVDSKGGCAYTSNSDANDKMHRLIRYNHATKRFALMDCHMPTNQATGTVDPLRAHTRDCDPDGLFWCVTSSGELFTFNPECSEIIDKGINWPGAARYCCSIERSPKGRYLYYNVMSEKNYSPVIQLDTKTGTKKVLAFLYPYYHEKYGYMPTGSYSFRLDDKGETLFMVWSGAFIKPVEKIGTDFWGHCSVMFMRIPASEREE